MSALANLRKKIDDCQGRDRHRFRKRLNRATEQKDIDRIAGAIQRSAERRQQRANAALTLNYPAELPVSARREEVANAIMSNSVVVICGETGSGKTTQIPKICLEIGRGVDGLIGHTQPRRLAARAVAARIADEMNSTVGALVGFQTRFNKQVGDDNRIKVMTDGILLTEIQRDRFLNDYDTLIIDEAHERSLNIDFLLGYLKQLLRKRRDLKLIITSATLDAERIAAHFNDAPILNIAGRSYPVDVLYRPLEGAGEEDEDLNINTAIDNAIDELQTIGRGDVLVFLPGEREIRDASKALRHRRERFDILALYARLSNAEQQRIFRSSTKPRIILSTNVAETSLTVPGIRYVVDTGLARISRYSWRAQIQRLPVDKISRASASQRAGRCGRLAAGVCIRLYAEDDFSARREFTEPEIQRTNLAQVILQMAHLRLGSVEAFPFIDRPDPRLVRDGYRLLNQLQAVGDDKRLTDIGRQLVRLPIDPRLARMLVAANEYNSIDEVLTIVTALAVGDPRERPFEKQQAADTSHQRFADKQSDFAAILNLWRYLDDRSQALSISALRRLFRQEFLSFRRWREWRDLHRQVTSAAQAAGLKNGQAKAEYDDVHRALLTGLLDHVGIKDEKGVFIGPRNRRFYLFPGSALKKNPPKWVMAAEITETTQVFARTLAGINPRWIESLGAHLLQRQISEPHWGAKPARASAYEKLLLNGLVVVARRRIDFTPIDPVLARELFIRHALVLGEWRSDIQIVKDNRAMLNDADDLEARTRRRDLQVSEDELYEFYAARVPSTVNSGASFTKWTRRPEAKETLRLTERDVFRDDAPTIDHAAYPVTWRSDGFEIPLTYRFDPGAADDGVSLQIPLALLNKIDAKRCEWLVPGMLEEKIVALLRALPKRIRKNFIPVPEFARAAREAITIYDGDLHDALANALLRKSGIEIPRTAWSNEIEPHLRMRFVIVGDEHKALAHGRDFGELKRRLESKFAERPPTSKAIEFERVLDAGWDCGDIPLRMPFAEDGYTIDKYPALCDENGAVALRLFDNEIDAERHMRAGLVRLLLQALKSDVRYLNKNLPDIGRQQLIFAPVGSSDKLVDDILKTAAWQCFLDGHDLPRSAESFAITLARGREKFIAEANAIGIQLGVILDCYSDIRTQLSRELPLSWVEAARDVETQLGVLVYPGFLSATPRKWLERYPRYLKAALARLSKLSAAPDKDRLRRSEIEPLHARLEQAPLETQRHPQFAEYRWLLEELRVSLFAQEIGAAEKVSVKRLDKLWRALADE